ncbi:hypothetical protein [Propionivibrio dicarboxylicus]|uniref:hypothetical protein n=1 Tax=Propionivibrio dicarboxylicus TaxID=83767 RepID=UPI0015A3345E|nr:hypothetical protein [Propionivibrio dicarboxylicus]
MFDVRNMLSGLDIQSAEFSADYKDSSGRMQEEFCLPEDLALAFATRYDVRH